MQGGQLDFFDAENKEAHISIQRVQIEQDTAKTINHDGKSLIDYNRAGMPLLEIVTDPMWVEDPEDCKLVVRELQDLLSTCGISEAKIEQGQLRVDVNISVWNKNDEEVHTKKVEVKNVAGAKNVERAVEYELKRHVALLEGEVSHGEETRRFDAIEGKTILMRTKDQDYDYRFFQEPDLPDIDVTQERIHHCEQLLTEVPFKTKKRFTSQFNLDVEDVKIIFKNPWSLDLFIHCTEKVDSKVAFEW